MRNLFKKALLVFVALFVVFAAFGCGKGKTKEAPYISLDDYKAYVQNDLDVFVERIQEQLTADLQAKVDAQYKIAQADIDGAESVAAVMTAYQNGQKAISEQIPLADGVYSFAGLSTEEKTKILGILEAYAVDNGLTGISLFENGGYDMYSERVTLGTEQYIPGYGFGILAEGSINADLDSEPKAEWKRYYHTINASDPGTANYWNDQGSEVADFYGYFGASYFTTFMNDTKDGYDWVPELANSNVMAFVDGEWKEPGEFDGATTKWRFEVKTGADGLKYNTNSKMADRQAFDGREVALEDYITPYKILLNASNELFRGSEAANGSSGVIKGAKAYYDATGKDPNASFDGVAVKVYEENGKNYFEYEFTAPYTAFYARYYISSSIFMPIPQEFIDLVGLKNYLGFSEDATQTPVDNTLSLGAYTLEQWDSGQQVVYKKNPYYVFADSKYSIPGIHINILTAAASDPEAGINEFLNGKTDASGIPQTRLDEFKNDPRTRKTTGDSVFKLNVNAANEEVWEGLFGTNGSAHPTPENAYWPVEPALSNQHFLKALSLSINRNQFAEKRGSIASVDWLSSNYLSDPENGISYANTDEHKEAVKYLLDQTTNGYNLELAREYFRVALEELEASGAYTPGYTKKPTVIELEIAWQYPQHEEAYHNEIKQFLEEAFNDPSVCQGLYRLDVKFWVGAQWSDVYYNKMMIGQFDLGFGSISGNSLDPLAFLNVLSSDISISGDFTLNWGPNTNAAEDTLLVYGGERWSYDALYTASQGVAVVEQGNNVAPFTTELKQEKNADGTYNNEITIKLAKPDVTTFEVEDLVVCWYDYVTDEDYKEESVIENAEVTSANGVITIKFVASADLVAAYAGNIGFDVYYLISIDGNQSESLSSVYGVFEK